MQDAPKKFIADLVAVMKKHNIQTLEVSIDDRSDWNAIRHGEGMMYHEEGSSLLAVGQDGTAYELAYSEYGEAVFSGNEDPDLSDN